MSVLNCVWVSLDDWSCTGRDLVAKQILWLFVCVFDRCFSSSVFEFCRRFRFQAPPDKIHNALKRPIGTLGCFLFKCDFEVMVIFAQVIILQVSFIHVRLLLKYIAGQYVNRKDVTKVFCIKKITIEYPLAVGFCFCKRQKICLLFKQGHNNMHT